MESSLPSPVCAKPAAPQTCVYVFIRCVYSFSLRHPVCVLLFFVRYCVSAPSLADIARVLLLPQILFVHLLPQILCLCSLSIRHCVSVCSFSLRYCVCAPSLLRHGVCIPFSLTVCAPSPSDTVCVCFLSQILHVLPSPSLCLYVLLLAQTCVCSLFQPIPAVPHYMLRLSPTQGRVAPRQRSEEPPACILPSLDYSDNKQPRD